MAEDEIGGLALPVTVDLSQLRSGLASAQAQLQQFRSRAGTVTIPIEFAISQPVASALRSKIVGQIGIIPLTVEGIFRWKTPPPAAITMAVTPSQSGGGSAAPGGAPVSQPRLPVQQAASPVGQLATPPPPTLPNGLPASARLVRDAAPGGRQTWYNPETNTYSQVFKPGSSGPAPAGAAGPTGFSLGGAPIRTPGPSEFFGQFGGGLNLQQIMEDLAKANRRIAELTAGTTSTAAQAVPTIDRFRVPAGIRDPRTGEARGGQFVSRRDYEALMAAPPQPAIAQPAVPRLQAAEIAAQFGAGGRALGPRDAQFALLRNRPEYRNLTDAQIQTKMALGDFPPEIMDQLLSVAGQFEAPRLGRGSGGRPGAGGPRLAPAGAGSQIVLPEERAAIFSGSEGLQAAEATRAAARQAQFTSQLARPSSPRVAVARALGGFLGVPDVQALQEEQQRATTRLRQLEERETTVTSKRLAVETKLQDAYEQGLPTVGALSVEYDRLAKSETDAKTATRQQREVVEDLTKQLTTAGGPVKGFVASFAGGVAGGLAFGAAMQVVAGAIGLAADAFGPVIDRMTGYVGLSNRVVDTLSDQARAQHGLTGLVVANTFAQAGLGAATSDAIRPYIEQRVAVEAGNKALRDQFDLIKVGQQLRFNPNLGITTGTGGIGGTPLFQTPGTIEQLAGLTPRGTLPQQIGANLLPGITTGLGAVAGFAVGGPVGGAAGAVGGNLLGNALFSPDAGSAQKLAVFKQSLVDLNEAAARGAPNVRDMAAAVQSNNQAVVEQTAQLLLANGASQDWVDALKATDFALVGPNGAVATQQQYLSFFRASQRGAAIPDPQETSRQLRDLVIPARQFQLQAQAALQRTLTDISIGVSRAARPFLPFGTGILPGATAGGEGGLTTPGGLSAVSPAARALIGTSPQRFDQIQVQQISAARVQIEQLVTGQFGARAGAQAVGSFDRLQGLGQQAAGLQSFITRSQLGLEAAQYAEQLRQATLSQRDLLQLTGRIGATSGDNLGLQERTLITYQRQSAELQLHTQQLNLQSTALEQQLATLQLELQQRQVNFQVALAGFTAPGITPAEREARIEQAEKEAKFAQEQLDIRKELLVLAKAALTDQSQQVALQGKIVPLQFQIQDTQFQRDLTTVTNQIALIEKAHQVNIDVAAASDALQRVNADIEKEQANLQSWIEAATAGATAAIADIASQLATYEGKAADFFDAVSSAYQSQFTSYMNTVIREIQRGLDYFSGGIPETYSTGYGGHAPGTGPIPYQTGFVGSFGGPTNIKVGEAGNEEVAIVRNPRQWLGAGSGVAMNIQIVITGNTVRSDEDLERLSEMAVRKLEERLSRTSSLLGLRSPS